MAPFLLENGADIGAKDNMGWTPLHNAAVSGHKSMVELLLNHQAGIETVDNNGSTPSHLAAEHGYRSMVETLLAHAAAVNARNNNGSTPLLLANKADANERNNTGQTPLDLAKGMAQAHLPLPGGRDRLLTPAERSKVEALAALLRQHGAVDDLPQLDRIQVRRTSTGQSSTSFTKGTHDWGQFTLLELIGLQYQFLAGSPLDGGGDGYSASAFFSTFPNLPFPDLAHLRIRRPASDPTKWQERGVDLRPLLESGDCPKDVRLEWGDVVEIPEANHPLNEKWPGFSRTELANLKKCLTRKVEIVINGQATNLTLTARISNLGEDKEATNTASGPGTTFDERLKALAGQLEPTIFAHTPFWLKPVLLQSKLLLTSSDLSRVKVTRRDAANGQTHEWLADCSEQTAPDFWLRDGDKIEVPEKTGASAAAEASGAPSSSPK